MHHKYKPKSNTALTMHSYSIEIYNAFSVCTPISSHCRVYSCSLLLFIAFFFIAQSFHPFLLRKHFNCILCLKSNFFKLLLLCVFSLLFSYALSFFLSFSRVFFGHITRGTYFVVRRPLASVVLLLRPSSHYLHCLQFSNIA